ncbi:MAG: hypothetical protein IPN82_08010 [Chitinophagaceae bacterium]|nr:hypothetical protein [Chitinophagaceae bacterium]
MQGTNANQCADVVNQLMDEYGDYSKELKNKTSDQMINFINVRMDTLGNELEIAQNALLSYIEENKLIDIEGQTSGYFENISAADKSINEELLKMNTADFIESYLKDKKNVYGAVVVPSSLGLNDATLNELVGGYNALQIKRQQLIDGNVPVNNPAVAETNGQIEKLRESLLENLSNIKRSYTKTIEALKRNSGTAQGQLQILPYKAKRYNELKEKLIISRHCIMCCRKKKKKRLFQEHRQLKIRKLWRRPMFREGR